MSRRARWTVAALAVLVAGCPGPREPPPLPGSPQPPAGAPRGRVKVPLPDGWAAQAGAGDTLRAGPPGHAVLRIEPRPGEGAALPAPGALAEGLRRGLRQASLSVISQKEENDSTVVVYLLTPETAGDAGSAAEAPGMVGAKRIGRDLFWCSSIPGASDDEADQAAAACAGLSVPPG